MIDIVIKIMADGLVVPIVVIGAGTIGAMTALAALAGGASRVILADLVPEKLALFKDDPAVTTVNVKEQNLAEVVKAAVIADAGLFARIEATTFDDLRSDTDLLTDAVSASIRVKADIVERDERESGDRRKLNLGHTLAHAIEKCTNRLNHGEAVAVGTALIADASVKLGVLTAEDRDRIAGVLKKLGFDLTPPVDVKRLLKEVGKDKKNEDGMLRIVVPIGIGDCDVRRMSHDEFAALFA
jgi:3-dehydroquinate synthase